MNERRTPNVLRLTKRHTPASRTSASAEDGARLRAAQSPWYALAAGLAAVAAFSGLWAVASVLTGRIFPWSTLLLGLLVGWVVRRTGRGVDWRFPVLAAALAGAGAIAANIVVAAAFTAGEYGTDAVTVLGAVTMMTWPVYFSEALSSADFAYAVIASAVAAYYANRPLSRAEFLALRRFEQEERAAGRRRTGSDGH
jgi:hypothetical protein